MITGAGRGFCVGQDLREFDERPGLDVGDTLAQTYHPNVLAIRALEKPVIAAVNGAVRRRRALARVRVRRPHRRRAASFVPGFVGIGLVPDSGGTFFIHRLLGYARAFEWMTSNRRLTAAEALEWGLVSEVVADDDFAPRVAELAAN